MKLISLLFLSLLSLAPAQDLPVLPLQLRDSDDQSRHFSTNILPEALQIVRENLPENRRYNGPLMTESLTIDEDSTIRVYFVGEGAGFANTLGYSTNGVGPLSPDAALIFPNVTSSTGFHGSGSGIRTTREPLLPGDFVDLGKVVAGTQLDFFLISNGANNGKHIFSTTQSFNRDGIAHAVGFGICDPNSTYTLIGFEDIWNGGDRDYNDVVFAVEVTKLITPEPTLALGMGMAVIAFTLRRKR